MSIAIKNSNTILPNTIKKDNLVIGVNDIEYGPTNQTGFYSPISIPTNGYVIYETNSSGRLRLYQPQNDSDLIYHVNRLGGNVTTVNEALTFIANSNHLFILDKPLDNIVTDGLVFYLDASVLSSYPKFGTTWNDLSGNGNNATLINGPTFDSGNGGSIQFDGVNDYANVPFNGRSTTANSVEMFFRWRSGTNGMPVGFSSYDIWTSGGNLGFNTASNDIWGISSTLVNSLGLRGTSNSNWHHYVFIFTNQVQNNKMYINGVLQTLSQQQGTTNLTTNRSFPTSLRLSGWVNNTSYRINGDYGYVSVYNRELSQFEILQNYNATKGRFGL